MTFLTISLVTYGLIALLNLWVYLILFFRDCSTPNTDRSSWIVLSLASLFWPVVLPLSYLERRAKMRSRSVDLSVSLQSRWDHIQQQNVCAISFM
jgi:hypothetical protein